MPSPASPPKVALVNMPFAPATRPSIQLGILKSVLRGAGIPCDGYHFTIDMLDLMRRRGHGWGPTSPPMLLEWYFSEASLTPQAERDMREYGRLAGVSWEAMCEIRGEIAPELLELAMEVDFSSYDVVGFTMTYPQVMASVALARRLKQRNPGQRILFGGAGSQIHRDSAAELLRLYPFLDAALLGEAEPVLAELVVRLAGGASPAGLPSVVYRHGDRILHSGGSKPVYDLDEPVYPDYSEYFQRRQQLERATRMHLERVIPIEFGRGCSWGDKRTCKFCAFTFHRTFRRRSKQRILEEVRHQVKTYGQPAFYIVDDLVTSRTIAEVFPHLPEIHPGLRIRFLETRTALTADHLDTLASAGVQLIQPGTESMDDALLDKMSKGTSLVHNVMFLKGCRERGIRVSHNIILGFPDATAEDLRNQLEILSLIPHLDPPHVVRLSLVRFSPYYEEREAEQGQCGFSNWRPHRLYRHIYPEGSRLEALAYEFEADLPDRGLEPLHRATAELVAGWTRLWSGAEPPSLCYRDEGGELIIADGRDPARQVSTIRLRGDAATLYRALCSKPGSPERLAELAQMSPEAVREVLDRLGRQGLVIRSRSLYLGLALDAGRVGWPARRVVGARTEDRTSTTIERIVT